MGLYFRRRDKWIGKIISFDDKEVWDVEHSVSVGETCQLRFFWTEIQMFTILKWDAQERYAFPKSLKLAFPKLLISSSMWVA